MLKYSYQKENRNTDFFTQFEAFEPRLHANTQGPKGDSSENFTAFLTKLECTQTGLLKKLVFWRAFQGALIQIGRKVLKKCHKNETTVRCWQDY